MRTEKWLARDQNMSMKEIVNDLMIGKENELCVKLFQSGTQIQTGTIFPCAVMGYGVCMNS